MFDSFSYPQYLVWEWFTLTSTRLHRPAAIIYFFIAWSETQLRYRNSLPWPAFKPSVPSRRRISGLAEFWPAAENPPKKMRPPKTPLNFRKLVSRRKNPAKFGWVGLYRKCISWLSFTCPHLLLQSLLNVCLVLWDWISGWWQAVRPTSQETSLSLFRAWQLQAFLTVTLILTVLSLQ